MFRTPATVVLGSADHTEEHRMLHVFAELPRGMFGAGRNPTFDEATISAVFDQADFGDEGMMDIGGSDHESEVCPHAIVHVHFLLCMDAFACA